MSLPTEHSQIEADLARLAIEPGTEPPAPFLAAVRARRRIVHTRRISAVAFGAIVVVTGLWFLPSPPAQPLHPSQPTITQETPKTPRLATQPVLTSPPAATLASLRQLYTHADSPLDLLATLPATPVSIHTDPPLRLRDTHLLLAEGV